MRRSVTDMSNPGVLTPRALNRAFLARQLLLTRAELPVTEALRHLYALQAQSPTAPYIALWTRLHDFRPGQLGELLLNRALVRIALMRSTLHLVRADDCLALRPIVQPALERAFKATYGRAIAGVDLAEAAAVGRALVEERPRTFSELGADLSTRWPEHNPDALAQAIRALVPLVQPPPRGIWGAGGLATHTSAEAWLGQPLDPEPDPAAMILRYLAAFGPASVMDVQAWTGLTRLKPILEALRPRLMTFRDEQGRELFDLPGAPRPDPEFPAPVRFLGEYDNTLLGHADRTRIMADEHRWVVLTVNGIIKGTVLVDGFVAATWRTERSRDRTTLLVEPVVPITPADQAAATAEAARLLAFAAPSDRHAIEFLPIHQS